MVSCRSAAKDYDTPINLRDLSPVVRRIWLRSKIYNFGIALLLLPWCIALLVLMARLRVESEPLIILPTSFSMIGLIMTAVSFRKVEYACFPTRVGTTGFDVARAGKFTDQFEVFVDTVVERIKASGIKAQQQENYA